MPGYQSKEGPSFISKQSKKCHGSRYLWIVCPRDFRIFFGDFDCPGHYFHRFPTSLSGSANDRKKNREGLHFFFWHHSLEIFAEIWKNIRCFGDGLTFKGVLDFRWRNDWLKPRCSVVRCSTRVRVCQKYKCSPRAVGKSRLRNAVKKWQLSEFSKSKVPQKVNQQLLGSPEISDQPRLRTRFSTSKHSGSPQWTWCRAECKTGGANVHRRVFDETKGGLFLIVFASGCVDSADFIDSEGKTWGKYHVSLDLPGVFNVGIPN